MRALLFTVLLVCLSLPGFAQDNSLAQEQAVIVHFKYGSKDLSRLFALEDKLEKAILRAKAGEYDGNEIAVDGSDGFLYMYGPDADRLFTVIKPVLENTPFMKGAQVKKRYGPPQGNSRETNVTISP